MIPTPAHLKALVSTGKRQRWPVDGQPSLYVQVTGRPGGKPVLSWVFRYRLPSGQQVNHTLGSCEELSWPEVKRRMIGLRQQVASGVRLAPPRLTQRNAFEAVKAAANKVEALATTAEKVQELIEIKGRRQAIAAELGETPAPPPVLDTTPTVRAKAEEWYKGHVLARNKPQTQTFQRWALDKYILPQLGDLKITELKRSKVLPLLDDLGTTPVLANRVKALISKMWNWSEARDETEIMADMPNPTRGYERHPEESRDRRLSEAEIIALGKAYAKAPSALNSAAIFILLTGCREGVVLNLSPKTKLHDGLLQFPKGMSGLKGCQWVYVPPVAATLLGKIEAPVLKRSLWRSWSLLRKSAGIGDVSIHDLRRTWASVGVDQGHNGDVIDVLQSHSLGKIRDTYQVRSGSPLAKVATEVSDHIAALLDLVKPKAKAKTVRAPAPPKAKAKAKTRAKV
jgi:integrase